MIKRSFFSLTPPKLKYDLLESDPRAPESIPVPSRLILLLNEPMDSTRDSLIKNGDAVEKGQKLSLYEDSAAYAVSPVTGTIDGIDTFSDVFGNKATAVTIKNGQNQAADTQSLTYDLTDDIASANAYLRQLPGAPPLSTLADSGRRIRTLVITCADKDLLSTTQQYVTLKNADALKKGVRILKQIAGVSRICATVPEDAQTTGLDSGLETVQILKTSCLYPSNLPAMILKDHFDTVLPAGLKPEDLGYCFITPEAVVSIAKAYETQSASFEKNLTVIGKTGERRRITATIGTPVENILKQFNIVLNERDRVVIGGPMTGFATYTVNHPVLPDTDMIIVQDKNSIPEVTDNACVNCGRCIQICPASIPVNLLVRFLEVEQYEEAADRYDLESCIDCGLCAYVCIARIPLYQYIRLGKYELFKLKADVTEDVIEEDADVIEDDAEMETANE